MILLMEMKRIIILMMMRRFKSRNSFKPRKTSYRRSIMKLKSSTTMINSTIWDYSLECQMMKLKISLITRTQRNNNLKRTKLLSKKRRENWNLRLKPKNLKKNKLKLLRKKPENKLKLLKWSKKKRKKN